ncbi:hypothetical protein ACO0KY_19195 [Undibacterium sp. Dicai25W]|uniref:hypothetical protein n=1 Tax=Undibacterium sp. Dicai25W TaxID=3413034 RepID=UPI003BF1AFA7
MLLRFIALFAVSALLGIFVVVPSSARAQIVAFPTEEKYEETILKLDDLTAQCVNHGERAIFKYVRNLKLLSWYRSESYSAVQEFQVNELSYGIALKDTGKPRYPGFLDIRDARVEDSNEAKPLIRTKMDFPGIFWVSQPRPNYSTSKCEKLSKALKSKISEMEAKIPSTFPELRKFVAMTEPEEFLKLSKLIGFCSRDGARKYPTFVGPTSFEAWISNNFSKSYGRTEVLSRPLYEQFQREMKSLGGMSEAARDIDFEEYSDGMCDGLEGKMESYDSKHPAL